MKISSEIEKNGPLKIFQWDIYHTLSSLNIFLNIFLTQLHKCEGNVISALRPPPFTSHPSARYIFITFKSFH